MNDVLSRTYLAGGVKMLKQSMHSFVLLYPSVLLEGWRIEKVSERYEGEKWGLLASGCYSTGMVRVKGFFSI